MCPDPSQPGVGHLRGQMGIREALQQFLQDADFGDSLEFLGVGWHHAADVLVGQLTT